MAIWLLVYVCVLRGRPGGRFEVPRQKKVVGHLKLAYDYNVLPLMLVVCEAIIVNVFLMSGKISGRAIALPAYSGSSGRACYF